MKKDFFEFFLVVLGYSIFHYFVCLSTSTKTGMEHYADFERGTLICMQGLNPQVDHL